MTAVVSDQQLGYSAWDASLDETDGSSMLGISSAVFIAWSEIIVTPRCQKIHRNYTSVARTKYKRAQPLKVK